MIKLNVDCLTLILNELQEDKNSLHSCLLVNREWCVVAVPILWKNHSWCNEHESRKKIFKMILSYLPSSSKQLLSDNEINLPPTIFLKPPLFNYVSFCKFPLAEIVELIIEMIEMFLRNSDDYDKKKKKLLEQEIYKLFVSQCKNIKELTWNTSHPLSSFPGAPTCFSQLCSLCINIDSVNSNALYEMAKFCKDLNELTIHKCSRDSPGLISLIDAQRNLKNLTYYPFDSYNMKGSCKELSKALARKGNTINHLCVGSISVIPPAFLTSLVNIKNILIYNCDKDDDIINEFHQCLAISKFPNLQSLDVNGLSCFKELTALIENTEGNVLQVIVETTNKTAKNAGMLIKAIANHCPNIERLSTHIEPKDFIHLKSLLLNCRNLVYLEFKSLNNVVDENNYVGDELLDNLVRFSSESLIDIIICGVWRCSIDAFERFFESYRGRTIRTFNINKYFITDIPESHKIIVRRYINEGVIKESNCVD